MKEQEGRERLTITGTPPTLKMEGNIIMLGEPGHREGQSPQKPKSPDETPQQARKNRVSPNEARKLWEPRLRGITDSGERSTIEMMMKEGIPPMSGGSDETGGEDEEARVFDEAMREAAREPSAAEVAAEAERRREIARRRLVGEERSPYADLWRRINEYKVSRSRLTPGDAAEAVRLREIAAGLTNEVNQEIDKEAVVESSQFPPELLQIASSFGETRERLINRILFRAFEDPTETRDYGSSMNLYAQSHLEVLLGFLEREDTKRYIYYQGLETAAQYFHAMNAKLIGGNLQQFLGIAENLNYQHFGFMQELRGVNQAMRIFEEKYIEFLARDSKITPQGYNELKEKVEKAFKTSNQTGLIKSEFANDRLEGDTGIMKQWEIERAVNIARTFFNITFRSAELISEGQVPKPLDEYIHLKGRYSSFPQESAVKIVNWMQWTLDRFQIAEPRGGLEFLNMVKKNYFEFLRDKKRKLGENRIVKFGGMKTEDVEVGAMFGVSGFYSSWRAEDMVSSSFRLTVDGETMSVEDWLTRNEDTVAGALKRARKKPTPENLDAYYNAVSPLIENLNVGLGWLIKHGMFGGEAGYRIRERLWKRVAENNLPLMVSYLSKLQFGEVKESKEKKDGKTVTERKIVPEGDIDSSPLAFRNLSAGWTEDDIDNFKRKIALAHEKRITQAAGEDVEGINIEFTPDESALMDRIKNAGRELAPQFADIVFPYIPFMNDIPFALLQYSTPGNEAYKRRISDWGNYNKAEVAFLEIMNNPGGMSAEEILKHFDEIVKGIESPQGTPDALERVFPMFKAWFDIIETKPGERQMVYKAIKESLRKPTSIAQEWAGMEALSADEAQVAKKVEEAHRMGILDYQTAEEMKKKKNTGLFGILWMLFRDYWYMPFIIGGKEFVGATYRGK